jgi:hypothetical protein
MFCLNFHASIPEYYDLLIGAELDVQSVGHKVDQLWVTHILFQSDIHNFIWVSVTNQFNLSKL